MLNQPREIPALGATPTPLGTRFVAWSTTARRVAVRLYEDAQAPRRRIATHPLATRGDGIFEGVIAGAAPGTLYKLVLDADRELPDPYARDLPFGVHGPARVVSARQAARTFVVPPFEQWIIYELHVGTFTPEGTFRAAAVKLPYLAELGVNAIELMPVHAFAGRRGWGYDGVALFAPHAEYGSGDDLAALVEAAHRLGIAAILDVVYNHFGPAGNYLAAYAPEYFTASNKTPWGDGPNFAHPAMRRLVMDNARYWLEEYGFDALRLDATHAIFDPSPTHVLSALASAAREMSPPRQLIAEDERNEPALVREMGLRAVWADDLHHQVRALLTKERDGYYAAYEPTVRALARCIERGWTYEGQVYPPSGAPRGKPAAALRKGELVYCIQNHDQVGNRAMGTRLHHDAPLDAYAAASMLLLFLPSIPLLFMGQEWAASSPFLYFSDHEAELGARVSQGRRDEFKHFAAFCDPAVRERIPDPQREDTFLRSKLVWTERERGHHATVLALYKAMIALRRDDAVLSDPASTLSARCDGSVLEVTRTSPRGVRRLMVNFGDAPVSLGPGVALLSSKDSGGGVLPPAGAVVLTG